ncbi:MAG: NADH-quinone oxidoreductase subunit N [Bdellovibrionia bacterium]
MNEFLLILPELILAVTLAFVVISEITYHGEQHRLVQASALFGLGAAFIQTLATYRLGPAQIFHGTVSVDGLSLFFKLLFIVLAALAVVASRHSKQIPESRHTEFMALILASTLAMCLAASSADLLLIFMALQCLNILGYFLAGYGKQSMPSVEAAVKYMVFSAVAGGLLLYGFALLFGHTQSLNLYEIHQSLLAHPLSHTAMLVIFMLSLLALCFQVGSFPMYFWTPDVLEGAPTPAAAFLSVGARAAGFAVATRFFISVFAQPALEPGRWQILGSLEWPKIIGLIAGMSMMIGSLLAYRQTSAKRLVSCLVIVQTGFMLLGILVLDQVGVAALLYNLVIELFALMGTFYVLSFFYEELGSDRLVDLRGMLVRAVPECICLVLFLLCLVGIPPMPGFIAKFTLIGAAVRHQWLALAALGVFSLTLSSVAIARLSFNLIGDLSVPGKTPVTGDSRRRMFLVVLVVPMVLAGVFANQVLTWAGKSLGFILW